jgi:hypothetical protein
MADQDTSDKHNPNAQETAEPAPPVFLGQYMPFAGVRYYAILGQRQLAGGGNKIGSVGWRVRAAQPHGDTEPQTPDAVVKLV